MKINISIPDELLTKLDEYAKKNFLSRSGAFQKAATDMIIFGEICDSLRKLSNTSSAEEAKAARKILSLINHYQDQMSVDAEL